MDSIVETCEQVCDAIESLDDVVKHHTYKLSINASVAKARVFYYIDKMNAYTEDKPSGQELAYMKIVHLVYSDCSNWKLLSPSEKYGLLRSLQILHHIFVYV